MMLSKLKRVRMERNLKQWEVARALKIPETRLSRFENGREGLKPDLAERLAEYYGVEVIDIMEDEQDAV